MAGIKVKVIKPAKMNQREFERVIKDTLKDTEKGILKDFERTTETWQHQVAFDHGHSVTASGGRAFVETDDEIYGYVNDGTKPHRIPKTGVANLRFQWGGKGSYRPKTAPGRLASKPGGPSGPVVGAKSVQHPGTTARKFDEAAKQRWLTLLPRALRDALGKGAKASGHGYP
jgi:hypothetical protein